MSRPLSRARRSSLPLPGRGSADSWLPWLLLGAITVAFAGLYCWLAVTRHAAFQSHAFDLGNMDQAAWNTLHGNLLRFTDMNVGGQVLTSRLAIHVEPILVALAPLYLIHSGPETLLVVQAVVVALGTVPAYLLARSMTLGPWVALVFPAAYLLHPSLQNALLDDFHPVTLSACFLLWALYFAWRGQVAGFLPAAVLAASTKENIGLLLAAVGLIFLLRRRRLVAAVTAVGGLGWFLICVLVIIPANNPSGHSPYLGRYSYLGHGLGGIITGVARHPGTVATILTSPARVTYLDALTAPFGFVSLLGLPLLVLALPSLAINMLSSDPHMYSGYYQYNPEILPFLVAAAALGVAAAGKWAVSHRAAGARRVPAVLSGLVLLAAVTACFQYGFSPMSYGYLLPSAGDHQLLEARLLKGIPGGAVVAAADEIEPHLSDRHTIYLLPTVHPSNGPAAQYLVLDASIPSLPTRPRAVRALVSREMASGYGVVAGSDGVLALQRGKGAGTLPDSFFSFLFSRGSHITPINARWRGLSLEGVTVHPRNGLVSRSRPDSEVEMYWRRTGTVPPSARIAVYLSPVYTGRRPRFSAAWSNETDSPAWDWLPLARWPRGRTVRAASLPLFPSVLQHGSVDVAVGVEGLGAARGVGPSRRIPGGSRLVRVGTVRVGW